MSEIRNKLNQRLIVNLIGGKNIDLLAKGTADVSEKELSSPHLQALIAKGDVSVIQKPCLKRLKDIKGEVIETQEMEELKEIGGQIIEKPVQLKRKTKK